MTITFNLEQDITSVLKQVMILPGNFYRYVLVNKITPEEFGQANLPDEIGFTRINFEKDLIIYILEAGIFTDSIARISCVGNNPDLDYSRLLSKACVELSYETNMDYHSGGCVNNRRDDEKIHSYGWLNQGEYITELDSWFGKKPLQHTRAILEKLLKKNFEEVTFTGIFNDISTKFARQINLPKEKLKLIGEYSTR